MPWRRRRTITLDPSDPDNRMRPVPDDLPKDGLFAQPLRIDRIKVRDPEEVNGAWRVAFVAFVRDAEGRSCPDIAVDAAIAGPERTGAGQVTTDLMGRATFRMTGPAGDYRFEITDVAAGALTWDRRDASATATTG